MKQIVAVLSSIFLFACGQVGEEQKTSILTVHNDLRKNIGDCKLPGQPKPATTLAELKWSEALATSAQEESNLCTTSSPGKPAVTVSGFDSVGQNEASGADLNTILQTWVKQNEDYTLDGNKCADSRRCDEYKKMVWGTTTDIGCGITECNGKNGISGNLWVVCNYGPSGDVTANAPYTAAAQATCGTPATEPDKSLILTLHNDLRQNVKQCKLTGQPPAEGEMPNLKWSEALATSAQEESNLCTTSSPSKPAVTVTGFASVGQNEASGADLNTILQSWVKQNEDYTLDGNRCADSKQCDKYKKMVWGTTTDIGCGITECNGKNGISEKLWVVCNYGPSGNVESQAPYKAGASKDCILPVRKLKLLSGKGQHICSTPSVVYMGVTSLIYLVRRF